MTKPKTNVDDTCRMWGPTAVSAAMRSYVTFKLGYEVDVPAELL